MRSGQTAIAIAAALVVFAQASPIRGQAGSIGGVVGNADKSTSAGGPELIPHQAKRFMRGRGYRSMQLGVIPKGYRISIDGRWHFTQICFAGKGTSEVEIHQAGGRFNGKLNGVDSLGRSFSGEISNGQIAAGKASFTVAVTDAFGFAVRQWTAVLRPSTGRVTAMQGTFFGRVAQCSFEAER